MTCSPEDHAILEAEYLRNSKPDKRERAAIVNRVALGEKEVQVRVLCGVRPLPEPTDNSSDNARAGRYGSKTVDRMIDGNRGHCCHTSSSHIFTLINKARLQSLRLLAMQPILLPLAMKTFLYHQATALFLHQINHLQSTRQILRALRSPLA